MEKPKIKAAVIFMAGQNVQAWGVGVGGVTEIRQTKREAGAGVMPYIEVYRGEHLVAEHCLHNIVGLEYEAPQPKVIQPNKPKIIT